MKVFEFTTRARRMSLANATTGLTRRFGVLLALMVIAVLSCGIANAADKSGWSTSDWPHRTPAERSNITTVVDTHETVMLLDLLRQGKQTKAEDVLFAMLDLRLMDVNDPRQSFSPGEQRQLCKELGSLDKLEASAIFEALSKRDHKQATSLRSKIAAFKRRCSKLK